MHFGGGGDGTWIHQGNGQRLTIPLKKWIQNNYSLYANNDQSSVVEPAEGQEVQDAEEGILLSVPL